MSERVMTRDHVERDLEAQESIASSLARIAEALEPAAVMSMERASIPEHIDSVLDGTSVEANTWQSAARRLAERVRELEVALKVEQRLPRIIPDWVHARNAEFTDVVIWGVSWAGDPPEEWWGSREEALDVIEDVEEKAAQGSLFHPEAYLPARLMKTRRFTMKPVEGAWTEMKR